MTLAVNIAQSGSNNVAFRNRIINGAMVIAQRGTGSTSVQTSTTFASCDRWGSYGSQNSKYTIQQTPSTTETGYATRVAAGFTNYLACTSSSAYLVAASDYFMINQALEGFTFADFAFGTSAAKTVTISFWAYSSLTGTFGGAFGNYAGSRSYPFTYTISNANTWTQISVTIAGDTAGTWVGASNNGAAILYFGLGVGSTYSGTAGAWASANYVSATGATSVVGTNGATFYITGVQLEAGTTASPFEYRQYTTELQLCERYCQRILGRDVGNTSSDWMGSGWNFTTTLTFTTVPLRTMLRSATGQSLYLSAAVGNYYVLNSSGTPIATSSMSIDTPSTRCLVITANVASGLTSGYPGSIYTGNSSSYYALITAEL